MVINPVVKQINKVCTNKVNPIAKGWVILKKIIPIISIFDIKINWIISRGSLIKILILGINDKKIFFLLKF